jgi:hypothetical protein
MPARVVLSLSTLDLPNRLPPPFNRAGGRREEPPTRAISARRSHRSGFRPKKSPWTHGKDPRTAPSFFVLCAEPCVVPRDGSWLHPVGRSSDSRIFLLPAPSHLPPRASSGSLQVSSPVTAAGPCRIAIRRPASLSSPNGHPQDTLDCFDFYKNSTGSRPGQSQNEGGWSVS